VTSDADRRALERFVAGLPVDPDALARAVTAKAVDRAIVMNALLNALVSPEPAVRRRAARRVERMPDVDPQVLARLAAMAEHDADERTRATCAQALSAHPSEEDRETTGGRRPPLGVLVLRLSRTRTRGAPARGIPLVALRRAEAPDLLVRVHDEGGGAVRFDFTGLPERLEDTRPALYARPEPGAGPLAPIASATESVSGGELTLRARLDAPPEDIEAWLAHGVELATDGD
jgi:hypothetical protein